MKNVKLIITTEMDSVVKYIDNFCHFYILICNFNI